jgi:hypothetical protein
MTAIVRRSEILTSIRVALPSERGESCISVEDAQRPIVPGEGGSSPPYIYQASA